MKILVTVGCGGTSGENCTYFENTNAQSGDCVATICKQNNVCQVILWVDS